jgi:hypothetical protein
MEPTFDWANESEEPDKTIERIFEAISNPELASQPLPDTELSMLNTTNGEGQPESGYVSEEVKEAMWLNELVGEDEAPISEAVTEAATTEDFAVDSEPQLGLDAFAAPEQPIELLSADHLLWDNPKAKVDRLVILSNKSIVFASPKETDVPHILGLFEEKKMLRDLLGEEARAIKLESIQKLTVNPKDAKLLITYTTSKEKPISHQLVFSDPKVRDEVLTAMMLRLGANFAEFTHNVSLADKIVPPVIVLSFVVFLIWGILSGLPLLSALPDSQLGLLQRVIDALNSFVTLVGRIWLLLILVIGGVSAVAWLWMNLRMPSTLVTIQRAKNPPVPAE